MKYAGMPFGMWVLFAGSFQKQLTDVLGYDAATARAITKNAKPQYRQIIAGLPEFEKADRFKMNLVNCAMVGAFILSMPQRPEVDRLTDYYARSMMTAPMRWFCRKSGKSKFTPKDIVAMKATADLKAADRNPYSWNMEFYEYPDGSGYEGRFTKCGICVLMSGNVLHNSMWTAAGAITSAIALSETFNALSQGVVEMQENPYDMIYDNSFYEVQKYVNQTNHVYSTIFNLLSVDIWNGLSEDQQNIITETSNEMQDWTNEYYFAHKDEYLEKLKEAGMQVNEDVDRDDIKNAMMPAIEEFLKSQPGDLWTTYQAICDLSNS